MSQGSRDYPREISIKTTEKHHTPSCSNQRKLPGTFLRLPRGERGGTARARGECARGRREESAVRTEGKGNRVYGRPDAQPKGRNAGQAIKLEGKSVV